MKKSVPLQASIHLAIGLLFILVVSGSQSCRKPVELLR